MPFILAGFFALAILLGAAWFAVYVATRRSESARLAKEEREAETERRLRTPGEPLYCAACQRTFLGPLTDDGCPGCHCAAFVIPDPEQRKPAGATAAAAAPGGDAAAEPRTVQVGRGANSRAD